MSPPDPTRAKFPSTSWTLIQRVQKGTEAEAARAMEEICRQYWYPIYAFARRSGRSIHDAEDVTQLFFQRVISSATIHAARQEKGRLRTFMLSLLKRVLANHARAAYAEKRGGSPEATLSIDDAEAEAKYAREPAEVSDPDAMFDRAWAEGVLESAERKLREDFAKAENLAGYEQLRPFLLLGADAQPQASTAKRLGLAEGTLRLQIHRLRKRYGKLIEEEIAQTVENKDELKAELAHLMAVMGR